MNNEGFMELATPIPVSYTHLRAHETPEHLVCRLLLEKKESTKNSNWDSSPLVPEVDEIPF